MNDPSGRLGSGVFGSWYPPTLREHRGCGAVRIGFCHYHTLDEVDRVLGALEELAP